MVLNKDSKVQISGLKPETMQILNAVRKAVEDNEPESESTYYNPGLKQTALYTVASIIRGESLSPYAAHDNAQRLFRRLYRSADSHGNHYLIEAVNTLLNENTFSKQQIEIAAVDLKTCALAAGVDITAKNPYTKPSRFAGK